MTIVLLLKKLKIHQMALLFASVRTIEVFQICMFMNEISQQDLQISHSSSQNEAKQNIIKTLKLWPSKRYDDLMHLTCQINIKVILILEAQMYHFRVSNRQ